MTLTVDLRSQNFIAAISTDLKHFKNYRFRFISLYETGKQTDRQRRHNQSLGLPIHGTGIIKSHSPEGIDRTETPSLSACLTVAHNVD